MLFVLRILKTTFGLVFRLIALAIALHTLLRLIRHFYKFPMPATFASYSDNPVRRRIFPPEIMPVRHGIEPGMKVEYYHIEPLRDNTGTEIVVIPKIFFIRKSLKTVLR